MIYESAWGPIYYDVSGPKQAPVIAFTHGVALDHATFSPQVAALCPTYRLVVWDLPEHGRSFRSGSFRFSVAADCLMGVLDAAGADRAVLVGQSLGSLVNQFAAHKYPKQASGLVHLGGLPLHQPFTELEASMWRVLLPLAALLPERTLYRWFARERAIKAATRRHLEASIAEMGKRRMISITKDFLRDLQAGIPEPPDAPLMIAHGEHEIALVRSRSAKWHANTPGSRLVVIPDAGHIANQDNPEAFNQALESFMDEVHAKPSV